MTNVILLILAILNLNCKAITCQVNKEICKENANTLSQDKQDVQGLYVLKTCENSRFKIKIEKKSGILSFSILDGKKTISKGKVKKQIIDNVTYLTFGKIEGMYEKNKIQVQNYGNSMNEYEHFTQCEEKYLAFIKS
ncbi:hypothetical protein NAT51_07185 [Flavobacterium amniphilum]|uniref:hypothetical protein n=1 Tax=Flavobacterium amniphilum TaxID=1834035 RepID=UPI00202A8755|nr:hypothetical protein [Flavobacterium amniphilum]MCL9805298.1 hypothetical protein [Flavobacterium amniphilum]